MSPKNAMFAGACWKLAAPNAMTASITGMYLPISDRPIVAKNAARPTSQFANTPERTALNQPSAPPIERNCSLSEITSFSRWASLGP